MSFFAIRDYYSMYLRVWCFEEEGCRVIVFLFRKEMLVYKVRKSHEIEELSTKLKRKVAK